MNPIIRADGNPKFAMVSTLAGAVINIILDPIFIFVLQMGHDGRGRGDGARSGGDGRARRLVSAAHENHQARVRRAMPCTASICGQMLTLGITSFLSQISLVAAMAAINNMLRQYGALDPVFGQAQIRPDPHGGGGHRDEVLPDRHFHRGRHGGGLHSHRRLQHGREEEDARAEAVHACCWLPRRWWARPRSFWRKVSPVS